MHSGKVHLGTGRCLLLEAVPGVELVQSWEGLKAIHAMGL